MNEIRRQIFLIENECRRLREILELFEYSFYCDVIRLAACDDLELRVCRDQWYIKTRIPIYATDIEELVGETIRKVIKRI